MLARKSITSDAPKLWKHLNGIINIYKPAGLTMRKTQNMIIANICRDMNQMKVRPPREIVTIEEKPNYDRNEVTYVVKQEQSLADNVLVVGERYQPVDLKSTFSCYLGRFTSGVMVLGINGGTRICNKIRENRPIRVYHVTGRLGRATESHFNDSAVTIRASFDHVTLGKMNSFLSSLQASHQKKMFDLCGVDIQTQAAYDLAVQGPLRPSSSNVPLIYSMRCIEFQKPHFTIEIHAVNESEAYLGILVHEIGISLKSVAYCTQIRCIRQAHFTLEDSIVRRHWNIESIMQNMNRCRSVLNDHPEMLNQIDSTLQLQDEKE